MKSRRFILQQQDARLGRCREASAEENPEAARSKLVSSPSTHSQARLSNTSETPPGSQMRLKNHKPAVFLILLLLISFSRPAFSSTLSDGSGLLHLVVRVQNEDGTGLSGIYCRHIIPEVTFQHLSKDRIRRLQHYYSGSVTAGNDSGVAVIPVYATYGYQDEKFLGAAAGGQLVLVHPHDGATTLALDDNQLKWKWSEALGAPVAYLGLVYDEKNKKWKVVP